MADSKFVVDGAYTMCSSSLENKKNYTSNMENLSDADMVSKKFVKFEKGDNNTVLESSTGNKIGIETDASTTDNLKGNYGTCMSMNNAKCVPHLKPIWYETTDEVTTDLLSQYILDCVNTGEAALAKVKAYLKTCNDDFDDQSFFWEKWTLFNDEYEQEKKQKAEITRSLAKKKIEESALDKISKASLNPLQEEALTNSSNDLDIMEKILEEYHNNAPSDGLSASGIAIYNDAVTAIKTARGNLMSFLDKLTQAQALGIDYEGVRTLNMNSFVVCTHCGFISFVDDGFKRAEAKEKERKRLVLEYIPATDIQRKEIVNKLKEFDKPDPVSKSQMEIVGQLYGTIIYWADVLKWSNQETIKSVYLKYSSIIEVGWKDFDANYCNSVLNEYGIISPRSIEMLISHCTMETNAGKRPIEMAIGASYVGAGGNKTIEDAKKYKGGGYAQLTFKNAYFQFYTDRKNRIETQSLSDEEIEMALKECEKIMSDGADYVGAVLPWESAAFFWTAVPEGYSKEGALTIEYNIKSGCTFWEIINQCANGNHKAGKTAPGLNWKYKEALYDEIKDILFY